MSFNRDKILAKAQKYLQKGQNQEAIKQYEKILEVDPRDVRILQKVGDLYARMGNVESATEYFRKVAELYAADGFFLKAVAVYKQISKLDPGMVKVYLRLAELYNQLGLNSEAMKQYQIVMKHYEKRGMKQEYLNVVKKLADLDPDNIVNRMRLADLYAKEGQKKEAIAEYKQIALEQKEKGNLEDLTKIYESILDLEPDDMSLTQELAATYLKIGEPKKALAKLQICFKHDPKDTDTLNLLAKAFWDLQQPEKAKSVYQEMMAIFQERGMEEERLQVERRMNELFNVGEEGGDAAEVDLLEGDDLVDMGDEVALEELGDVSEFSETYASEVEEVEAAPDSAEDEVIDKLLSEVDVYIKYGLVDKALDNLFEALQIQPANTNTIDVLLSVAGQISDKSALVKRLEHLLAGLEGEGRDPSPLKEAIEKISFPAGEESEEESGVDEPSVEVKQLEAMEDSSPEVEIEEEISIDLDLDSVDIGDDVKEDSSASAPVSEAGETIDISESSAVFERPDEGDVSLDVGDLDLDLSSPEESPSVETADEETGTPDISLDLDVPLESEQGGGTSAEVEPSSQESNIDLSLDIESPPQENKPEDKAEEVSKEEQPSDDISLDVDVVSESVEDTGDSVEEVEDVVEQSVEATVIDLQAELREKFKAEMEEAEFFTTQALYDEARLIYKGILKRAPNYEPAKAKLKELEALIKKASAGEEKTLSKPPAAEKPEIKKEEKSQVAIDSPSMSEERPFLREDSESDGGFFDLASALADEIEALEKEEDSAAAPAPQDEAPTFEEVFSKFKEGIKKTVKEEDYQTHYDLGIAYKEMGLYDDAITEFAVASRGPGKEKDCNVMIALCYLEKGDPQRAVLLLEKALSIQGLTPQEILGIKYDLASAREANGEKQKALKLLQEIEETSPGFRDVKARIKKLLGKGGGEESGTPSSGSSEKISYI